MGLAVVVAAVVVVVVVGAAVAAAVVVVALERPPKRGESHLDLVVDYLTKKVRSRMMIGKSRSYYCYDFLLERYHYRSYPVPGPYWCVQCGRKVGEGSTTKCR